MLIKKAFFNFLFPAVFLILSGDLFSQKVPEIETDRPDQAESPLNVPAGFIQVEMGSNLENENISSTTEDENVKIFTIPGVLIRYGITDNIELRLGSEFLNEKSRAKLKSITQTETDFSTYGITPIEVGAKIHLMDEDKSAPETALLLGISLPLFNNSFDNPHLGGEIVLAMTNTVTKNFGISYNLGTVWDGNSTKPIGLYALSLGFELSKKISAFAESFGYVTKNEKPDHRLDAGFTYLFTRNLQADISGGLGISSRSPDYFISIGFSFRLPR